MEKHVPTLETSQKLKEAGFPQETFTSWVHHISVSSRGIDWGIVPTNIPLPFENDSLIDGYCAAPLLTEILEQLPKTTAIMHASKVHDDEPWEAYFVSGSRKALRLYAINPAEAAALLWLELNKKD